jgi:hypothetical protein
MQFLGAEDGFQGHKAVAEFGWRFTFEWFHDHPPFSVEKPVNLDFLRRFFHKASTSLPGLIETNFRPGFLNSSP